MRLKVSVLLVGIVATAFQFPAAAHAQDESEWEFDDSDLGAGAKAPAEPEKPAKAAPEAALEAAEVEKAAPAAVGDKEALRRRRLRLQNTWEGSTGGVHVLDAGSAPAGTFRLQLDLEGFKSSDFLEPGDHNGYVGVSISLGWTLTDHLEAFASIQSHANSNNKEEPQLLQVFGDTYIGAKAFYPALPWLTLGGDLRIAFLNSVGKIGLFFSGTSFGLRGNASADFRNLEGGIPLIARFNLGYFFDNSANLIEDVENQRYEAIVDPLEKAYETRNLISRVERFALGINRDDLLTFALGFEAPLEAATDFTLQPIIEWALGVPVNRRGFSCLYIDEPNGDSCLAKSGVGAWPSNLTLGLRILPPVRGLGLLAAADIGVSGATYVRELAPNPPYNLIFALSYAYDTRPPRPIVRQVPAPAKKPPSQGRIRGLVVEQGTATVIGGASVLYPARDLTAQQTGADGRFVSYQFDPGQVQIEVTHPEYQPGACVAAIPPAGGDVELQCELAALPRLGGVQGKVVGASGAPLPNASARISGPLSRVFNTDLGGTFAANDLPPGQYSVLVEAEGYLIKHESFVVLARQTASPVITLTEKPPRAQVRVTKNEIQLQSRIQFVTDRAEIAPSSEPLLAEIADVLIRNPQIALVEIQGHTDNRGSRTRNQELSQQRAESVRQWLISGGIDAGRLEARGYGPDRPLVPNLTSANRARNRRVQFIIKSGGGSPKPGFQF